MVLSRWQGKGRGSRVYRSIGCQDILNLNSSQPTVVLKLSMHSLIFPDDPAGGPHGAEPVARWGVIGLASAAPLVTQSCAISMVLNPVLKLAIDI